MMKYPYIGMIPEIDIKAVFPHLKGSPYILNLGDNPFLQNNDPQNQKAMQEWLDKEMEGKFSWGVSSYLEYREKLLSCHDQMLESKRFYHLGLDIIVPEGVNLHAPLDCTIEKQGYEEGDGNYGGFALLRFEDSRFESFYTLFGHLAKDELPAIGETVKAGDPFARTGKRNENGNWFYHTHMQILTKDGLKQGFLHKGYCSKNEIARMPNLCPDPMPLFKV